MGVAAVLTPIALYTRYINKDTDQIINQMINAVNSGDLAQTKKLLEAGHDVDSVFRGKGNHSAGVLSQAAMAGDLPMCQLLVSYGADLNLAASNQPMACPLGEAAKACNPELMHFLLASGATNPAKKMLGDMGVNVLHSWCLRCSSQPGAEGVVGALVQLDSGLITEKIDKRGNRGAGFHRGSTPLHLAVRSADGSGYSIAVIEALVAAGADLSAVESVKVGSKQMVGECKEMTPLKLARENAALSQNRAVLKLLIHCTTDAR